MTLLPTIRAKYGEGIGVELFFQFPDISENEKSYLEADSAVAASTLSANGINFAINQYILVGQPGNEHTEILQISSVSSTAIGLVSPATFAHNRGDVIRFIPFNQIAAEYSTDGSSYNTITAVAIRSDATETYMQRPTDLSSYYYRFRFFNSTSSLYSAYSSAASAAGYADNTIWSVKNRALGQLGEVIGTLITDQFLNDSIQEARRSVDQWPTVFRWSFRTKFGVNIGQLKSGEWQITVPSDLRDRNTYKNILSLRMGKQNRPCVYQDRTRFNQNYLNVAHSTLSSAATFGATTLALSNSADFQQPSGSLTVQGQTLTDTYYVITYTGNDMSGNLSGVSGIPSGGLASGGNAWQQFIPGLPSAYTIDAGVISFDVPLHPQYAGQNVHSDYYTIIPPITTDSQTFDEPFYDLYVSYLKYKIKYLKSNGKIDRDGDTDWKDWLDGATKLIAQETTGQRINFIPDVEGFLSATE